MPGLAVKFLASCRLLVGIGSLLVPKTTANVFLIPASPSSIIFRLFGARDAVLGGLLWSADTEALSRQALMIGAMIDAVDVVSTVACMLGEGLELGPAVTVGGGAALFLSLGLWGLQNTS